MEGQVENKAGNVESEYGISQRCLTADGVELAVYDFGGSGPDLVLVHATGFCAAVLAPMARLLSASFHCYGVDLRGQGASGRPTDGAYAWSGFALDVQAVVDHFALTRPYAFGHSCGGASVLLAEEGGPGTFAGIYAYEPVISPTDEPMAPLLEGHPLADGARRRRETFPSFADAFANFSSKPPFGDFDPDVLRGYVEKGFELLPAESGGDGSTIRLRCRRDDESMIYSYGFSHRAFAHLNEIECPVILACGRDTDAFGPSFLQLYSERLAHSSMTIFDGLNHFGPLQRPEVVAKALLDSFRPHSESVEP